MLSAANRVHANTGADGTPAANVSTITPALAGTDTTADHNTVLAFHATASVIGTPGDWIIDQSSAVLLYAFRRPTVAAGESSWAFGVSPASYSAWRVEEWTGVDLVDPLDAAILGTITAQGAATCSTGTTATTDSADAAVIAAFVITRGSAGQGVFPVGRSYSNGFTEVSYNTVGTGNAAGDRALAVAELYPGATGTFETTLTLDTTGGGTLSTVTMQGMVLVYRATTQDTPWNQGQTMMVG